MKSPLTHSRLPAGRSLLAAGVALLLLAAVAAPLLAPPWRVLVMDALAPLCHQLPERSFPIAGLQMGLCHRCTAMLLGLFAALAAPMTMRLGVHPAVVLLLALAPMLVDWGMDAAGLVPNTVFSRVLTGLWGGMLMGFLIGTAAKEDER